MSCICGKDYQKYSCRWTIMVEIPEAGFGGVHVCVTVMVSAGWS